MVIIGDLLTAPKYFVLEELTKKTNKFKEYQYENQ